MMEKKNKNQNFISNAIDKIRISLEVDKYKKEQSQIGIEKNQIGIDPSPTSKNQRKIEE